MTKDAILKLKEDFQSVVRNSRAHRLLALEGRWPGEASASRLYRIEHHGYRTKCILMSMRDIMKRDHS